MNVPDESATPGRKLQAFENIDIEGKLNGVVGLWLAVALVAATFLPAAGLDVTGHIAAWLFPQEIGYAKQVISANAADIDQGIAPRHGIYRESFAIATARLRHVGEGLVQLGD